MNSILNTEQFDYLQKFIANNDSLIKEMKEYAKANNVPILSNDSSVLLEQLILIKKPRRVLELGTAIAYSTIRIARCLSGKGVIHTIEKSKDNIAVAKKNIAKSKAADKIKLLEGNALEIMPSLDKKYDFIFLDADKIDYTNLFQYSLLLLKKGGVIFIDNLLWHGYAASAKVPAQQKAATQVIRDFNKIFTADPNLKATILPVGDGIGIGVKI